MKTTNSTGAQIIAKELRARTDFGGTLQNMGSDNPTTPKGTNQ